MTEPRPNDRGEYVVRVELVVFVTPSDDPSLRLADGAYEDAVGEAITAVYEAAADVESTDYAARVVVSEDLDFEHLDPDTFRPVDSPMDRAYQLVKELASVPIGDEPGALRTDDKDLPGVVRRAREAIAINF